MDVDGMRKIVRSCLWGLLQASGAADLDSINARGKLPHGRPHPAAATAHVPCPEGTLRKRD